MSGFRHREVEGRDRASHGFQDQAREHRANVDKIVLEKSAACGARSSDAPHLRSKFEPGRPSLQGKTIRNLSAKYLRRVARNQCRSLDARQKSSLSLA